jgi:hypothetical protein
MLHLKPSRLTVEVSDWPAVCWVVAAPFKTLTVLIAVPVKSVFTAVVAGAEMSPNSVTVPGANETFAAGASMLKPAVRVVPEILRLVCVSCPQAVPFTPKLLAAVPSTICPLEKVAANVIPLAGQATDVADAGVAAGMITASIKASGRAAKSVAKRCLTRHRGIS